MNKQNARLTAGANSAPVCNSGTEKQGQVMNWRDVLQRWAGRRGISEVWAIDTEYMTDGPGAERIAAVWCVCGVELLSGRFVTVWVDGSERCPFPTEREDVVFVAHNAAAEGQAFAALGWPSPSLVIDTMAEQRRGMNIDDPRPYVAAGAGVAVATRALGNGWGLVDSLRAHGLAEHIPQDKKEMRELAIKGGPWTPKNKAALLEYCLDDCHALGPLLAAQIGFIEAWGDDSEAGVAQAHVRGAFMWSLGPLNRRGLPMDKAACEVLATRAPEIAGRWIGETAKSFPVYEEGKDGALSLRQELVDRLIKDRYDPAAWPLTEASGVFATDVDTLRNMAEIWPELVELKEAEALRRLLSSREFHLEADGRLRVRWHPMVQKTGRTSAGGSPFAWPKGMRSLMAPGEGEALLYLDWKSQEFAIAAALSGDEAMRRAYVSGDVYLAFARQSGLIREADWQRVVREGGKPGEAFKAERIVSKAVVLGLQFGMTKHGLASALDADLAFAARMVRKHEQVYPQLHGWGREVVHLARDRGYTSTAMGWTMRTTALTRDRTILNAPIQGTGGDIMRLAVVMAEQEGLQPVATVHDALLFVAPAGDWQGHALLAREVMQEAGRLVLGMELGVDGQVVLPGERYLEGTGKKDAAGVLQPGPAANFWNRLAPEIGAEPVREELAVAQEGRLAGIFGP